MKRLFLAALAATAVLPATAAACSCVPVGDPRQEVEKADAAVFGEVTDVRLADDNQFGGTYVYGVRVIRDYKDNLAERITLRSSTQDSACGVTYDDGDTFGALLYRSDGPMFVGLCSVRSRAHLEAGVSDLPDPTGEGPPALLIGGAFGDARVASFDAEGALLGYGTGDGSVSALAACPGGEVALEVVGRQLVARALATLKAPRVIASLPRPFPRALECLAKDGSRAALLDNRATHVEDGRVTVGDERINGGRSLLARGTVWTPTKTVDVATGRVRPFGPLPPRHSVLALSPGGETLAVGSPRRIALVDSATGRSRRSHRQSAYQAVWLGDDALAALTSRGLRFFDDQLRVRGRANVLGPYAADGDELVIAVDGQLLRYDARGTKLSETPIFTTAVKVLCATRSPATAATARAR